MGANSSSACSSTVGNCDCENAKQKSLEFFTVQCNRADAESAWQNLFDQEDLAPAALNHRLLQACRESKVAEARRALALGGDVEGMLRYSLRSVGQAKALRPEGMSPLMLAAQAGSEPCVKLLIQQKAGLERAEEDGMRAIHFAAASGDLCVLQCLLEARADPLAADDCEMRVLDHVPEEVQKDRLAFRAWEQLLQNQEQA